MDNKLLFTGLSGLDCRGFKQLLDAQSLVDCTLACEGGKISAHKIVLSACSSYLAKILLEHPVEHPIIILPELNIEDVKTLVHYMYTGELLKSNTINSITLLRTAAILSINSLSDLLSSPSSPPSNNNNNNSSSSSSSNNPLQNHFNANYNNPFRLSQQLLSGNTNNNINPNTQPLIATHQQQHQQRISIVDQLSPLLAAISQHHQQQQQKLHLYQAQTNGVMNGGLSQNENQQQINSNSSASSHESGNSSTNSSLSSIIGAITSAASNGSTAAATNYYNGLAVASQLNDSFNGTPSATTATTATATNNSLASPSGSPSSTSSSPSAPLNQNIHLNSSCSNNNNIKLEPFSYSSAITGTSWGPHSAAAAAAAATAAAAVAGGGNHSTLSGSTTPTTTNEFQFKCPVCQNHFQTICSFEYHMQRAHSVTSFGCEICHKPFASLRYVLTDHMRRCHGWKGATTTGTTTTSSSTNSNNSTSYDHHHQKLQC